MGISGLSVFKGGNSKASGESTEDFKSGWRDCGKGRGDTLDAALGVSPDCADCELEKLDSGFTVRQGDVGGDKLVGFRGGGWIASTC